MLIVPIKRDKIQTRENAQYTVIEYTNYKPLGPAVYCSSEDKTDPVLVYFNDIDRIDDIRVDYLRSSRVFYTQNPFKKHKMSLPQPKDKVTFQGIDAAGEYETVTAVVKNIKLKVRDEGVLSGIVVITESKSTINLANILDIDYRLPYSSSFNRPEFMKIYKEYL